MEWMGRIKFHLNAGFSLFSKSLKTIFLLSNSRSAFLINREICPDRLLPPQY